MSPPVQGYTNLGGNMKFQKNQTGWQRLIATTIFALAFSGCGSSENFVFTSTNTNANPITPPIVVAPVANNDTALALGNATLNQLVANGVLTNDQVNGAEISGFDATTPNGGTVVLDNNGSFTYTPVFGFTGPDTFSYTLSNSAGSSTATVTVNVNNQGWFVNNSAAVSGNGGQASPFDNLDEALMAASSGDTIFVFQGDGTNVYPAGAFNLPAGVDLIGQANGLVLSQQIEAPGDRPLISGPIVLDGNNTVAGFQISNSADDGIQGTSVDNVTIVNNIFNTPTNNHINLQSVGGTCSITDNVFNNVTGTRDFVELEMTNTTAIYSVDRNTFLTDLTNNPDENAVDLEAGGTGSLTFGFNDNIVTSVDNSNRFWDGIEVDINDNVSCAVTMTGNSLTRCSQDALDLAANDAGASVGGTISGNTIDATSDNGIELTASDGTVTLAISGNMITSSSNASIFAETSSTGEMCLDITGNSVDDDMIFQNMGAFLQIEQLLVGDGGPLSDLNTFTGASVQNTGATSVPDNTCVLP
jgi:Bacterial Ig domain